MTQATVLDDVTITGLTADSRTVRPGYLFAAIPGTNLDGRDYIDAAVRAGAAAVLAPPDVTKDSVTPGVSLITADNPRRSLARIAAAFYGEKPETIVAVTGTNGKTSVANFTQQMWNTMGRKAVSLGTLGLIGPGLEVGSSLTTPDAVALHRTLHELTEDGVQEVALEASSHGLDQFRLDGVPIRAAAFTNLTRDHLDYHGSMAEYRRAKMRLFRELLPSGGAIVVNAETPEYPALLELSRGRGLELFSYGLAKGDIKCRSMNATEDGWSLVLDVLGTEHSVPFPLIGSFQVGNALAALGLVIACGGEFEKATMALETLEGVPGRMETAAQLPTGARIIVDYAHTPNALAAVLKAVRPHTAHRLTVVFGCGGDRDRGKRPEMGSIAARLADGVVVTDDNPRYEDPGDIRKEISAACPGSLEVAGRYDAIRVAISELAEGDILVVAGKGHETGQILGSETIPFSDVEVVRDCAREIAR
ncbi:MAG: UDP-N-acetylmuramoyl-L-alanyl-D-glutamate--2,6-diaminopimelate ligase [Alphaproteobacteria bacterium MarineAlpha4_Bin2]|nr:MAG: UDP-N-acetylmuramoyl-L-alanyl-D-glutamate--2,6-diaminopimelate ligase [Alphaproteobacteria bacterium MarineAlpha4_Bin2]